MPEIHTRKLGTVRYEETSVITFPAGLPGFPARTRFLLIERDAFAPIVFLHSAEAPELCFCAAPVAAVDPDYQLAMTEEDERLLRAAGTPPCLAILAILAPTPSGGWTANLLAPVVIDLKSRRGVQAVRSDARYSHQHPVGAATCS